LRRRAPELTDLRLPSEFEIRQPLEVTQIIDLLAQAELALAKAPAAEVDG
jgi:hypothetical protein